MAKTIDQIATGNLPVLSKVLRFNKLLVLSSHNLSHRWVTNRQLKLIHNYDLHCYQRKVLQILLMMFVIENPFWFWCRTKCWLLIFFTLFCLLFLDPFHIWATRQVQNYRLFFSKLFWAFWLFFSLLFVTTWIPFRCVLPNNEWCHLQNLKSVKKCLNIICIKLEC